MISPALEKMRQKGYKALHTDDLLDELCSQSIVDLNNKNLVDTNKAELDIDKTEDEKKELRSPKDYDFLRSSLVTGRKRHNLATARLTCRSSFCIECIRLLL